MTTPHHVVLATYGEPPTPSFTDQLAYSWRILLGLTRKVDAIPRPVLPLIAVSRARGRSRSWRDASYGSPLEAITERQAAGLAARLAQTAPEVAWRVRTAYEYRRPLVADVVGAIPASEPVWVVPLYAADSAFTHELTRDAVSGRHPSTTVLGPLDAATLADISADHVLQQTGDGWQGPDVALVLAAHGTVLDPSTPIETGREATEAFCASVGARLANRYGLVVNGWLNHTRGGRWTEPPIEEALRQVADAGYRRVVYYPYGFLGDNAESELEGRMALAQYPAMATRHLPCLNDAASLLDALASQVLGEVLTGAGGCRRVRAGAGGCGERVPAGASASR